MKKEEIRSQKRKPGNQGVETPVSTSGAERRKVLGWMGIGIVGAIAVSAMPFKSIPKRLVRKHKVRSGKAQVVINNMAVKRTRKVSRNG